MTDCPKILRRSGSAYLAIIAAIVFLGSFSNSSAQVLAPDRSEFRLQLLQNELYYQQQFPVSAIFSRKISGTSSRFFTPPDVEYAKYCLAQSVVKAELYGWEDSAITLVENTSDPVYAERVSFSLAQNYFHRNKLGSAIACYEHAGISSLSNAEITDQKFEMAYCYFNSKRFKKAEPMFASIKEIPDGKYYKAGNYYYGLLAYNGNNFKEALNSFNAIGDDRQYKTVVPYYIAETYYFMGDRKKALAEASKAIAPDAEKSFYDNELHLLVAQCLFEDQKYSEAIPYFDSFYEHTSKIRKEDLYKIAYCFYRTSDWTNAIEKFKQLSNAHDSLGQTSMYLLGDCYLKTLDKQSARNAYSLCADMGFNKGQQEASMMLYSMISYELGFEDEAARQLNNLITTFPETDYKDEANKLLSDLLIKTHKYENALARLEVIRLKDEHYRRNYQLATFGYAIEQYRKGNLDQANKYFALSMLHPINRAYETAACFWQGELAYRMHSYEDAVIHSKEFLDKVVEHVDAGYVSPQATAQHACINIGFASMALGEYKEAQTYFQKAQQASHSEYASQRIASVHEADAVFMQKNYSKALALYNKIIANDTTDADYAKFQKSIILGLLDKDNEKISLLQSLVTQQPPSAYAATARYEIALTLLDDDKYNSALNYLYQLTDSIADKSYAPRAWVKIAFIYTQQKEPMLAVAALKHILTEYPASEERYFALENIRNLYIQLNHPADFQRLLKDSKLTNADSSAVDSTYYAAAEGQYASGNWTTAADAFNVYLTQFPNGLFYIKAHYYAGECDYQLKNATQALSHYKIVLSFPWSDYSENSARHGAAIAFEAKDYAGAAEYFKMLRSGARQNSVIESALSGLMKCSFYSNKIADAANYADTLLTLPDISAENISSALLVKANAFVSAKKLPEALFIFKQLSGNKNGEVAAESHYHIAEIYYFQDSLQAAESAANETIRQSGGYDFWIVKSYILIADVFTKEKDFFNARATLESVIKHTKITELKDDAERKLQVVDQLEKQKSKLKDE